MTDCPGTNPAYKTGESVLFCFLQILNFQQQQKLQGIQQMANYNAFKQTKLKLVKTIPEEAQTSDLSDNCLLKQLL